MSVSTASVADLLWSVSSAPAIHFSGRFSFDDRGFEQSYRGNPMSLHCYEYAARLRIDKKEYAIAPGDVTLFAAWQVARYSLDRPGCHLCIHFGLPEGEPRSPGPVAPREKESGCFLLPPHVSAERATVDGVPFGEAMLRVIGLHTSAEVNPLARAAASIGLQRLLLALGMAQQAPSAQRARPVHDSIDQAATQLRSRLDDPLHVPHLARVVGLSQNSLARRFKERFGVSMPRYLLQCRMEYAMLLLTTTDLPVGQVGVRVGMSDPQHFNKQFRAAYGKSPTSARRAERGGEGQEA